MIEQSERTTQETPVFRRKSYEELKKEVTFLQCYGFSISYDYVEMLIEQIRLRDKETHGE